MSTETITYLEDGVIATFSVKPRLNNFIFETTGQREFDNVEYVTIRIPGDKHTEIVEEVREDHKNRFKNSYRAFKEGNSLESGIPLANFPDIDPATLEKMKFLGIHTVEALSGVADNLLANIGARGRELRDRAQKYLSTSKDERMSDTVLKQNEEIQNLKAQLQALTSARSDDSAEETKRGPGRPKIPPHMQKEE